MSKRDRDEREYSEATEASRKSRRDQAAAGVVVEAAGAAGEGVSTPAAATGVSWVLSASTAAGASVAVGCKREVVSSLPIAQGRLAHLDSSRRLGLGLLGGSGPDDGLDSSILLDGLVSSDDLVRSAGLSSELGLVDGSVDLGSGALFGGGGLDLLLLGLLAAVEEGAELGAQSATELLRLLLLGCVGGLGLWSRISMQDMRGRAEGVSTHSRIEVNGRVVNGGSLRGRSDGFSGRRRRLSVLDVVLDLDGSLDR